jgi:hypothetical protein
MNFKLTSFDRLLKINVDFDIERNELISLIEKETTWEHHGTRSYLQTVQNNSLNSIRNHLMSNTITLMLLEEIYKLHPQLKEQWGLTFTEMYNKSLTNVYFCRDMPGHNTGLHLDALRLPFTGMIFLTEKDDELMSTYFYTDSNKNNSFRMTTNYGDGWFQANSHNSWHEGGNNTDIVRYAIIIEINPNWENNNSRN